MTRFTHICAAMVLSLATVGIPALGSSPQDSAPPPARMNLEAGKGYTIRGVVTRREADGLILRDAKLMEIFVLFNDATKLEIDKKAVTAEQRYELRKLVGGIVAEIRGKGDNQGRLVAERINVTNKDMRAAMAMANRFEPTEARISKSEEDIRRAQEQQAILEAKQKMLEGQVSELDVLSKMAMEEARKANDRVSALDDYNTLQTASVLFAVNSAVLTAQAKKDLDALVAQSANLKAVAYEITGYTDTTGGAEKNRILSEKRANAVVRYLADTHKIPLRRIVTPLGFGAARPAADNTTQAGREANRRVEVKLMQQGGIAG